jgi:hypothetical protein
MFNTEQRKELPTHTKTKARSLIDGLRVLDQQLETVNALGINISILTDSVMYITSYALKQRNIIFLIY